MMNINMLLIASNGLYSSETNQLLEFVGTAGAIFAFAMIVVSVMTSIMATIFASIRYRKEKRRELFFEYQIKAYQEYLHDIFGLVKHMRVDINTFQTMDKNEALRDFVGVKLMKSQLNAIIFSSDSLYSLIKRNDIVISKLVVAKDVAEYLSLIDEVKSFMDETIKLIRREIVTMKK